MAHPRRVLVDATAIPPDRGGVGRYLDHLIAQLDAAGADLVVATQRRDAEAFGVAAPGARLEVVPTVLERRPLRLLWEQTGLPLLARRAGARVVFNPHYTLPLATTLPRVVTLHDATFFSDPNVHLPTKARFFRAATRASLRVARRCVVPSAATRDELVRLAGADATRIDVVPHGVDHEDFRPPTLSAVDALAARLGIEPGRYVAFLGTLEPRKNLPALVEGWVAACASRQDAPALVLAGSSGWDSRLDEVLTRVPAHLRVIRTGYLPFADLPALLGGATVVAYPSLGEGFGLPVLEAMACGAAVLTTRRLSLPEVGGDAVAYTEPDASSIASALAQLLDDPGLRRRLGDAAAARARGFTWARSAEGHLRAFEEAAA